MTNQEWQKMSVGAENWQNWQEVTQTEADKLNDMYDAIIRLQERVRALERAQEMPNNAFWWQLMFDVFVFVCIIVFIVWRA